MAKKIGTLIREARTASGLTQEQLSKKVKGLSAADISKAERGEKTLTQEQLKEIAKATGVTQKSLLEAAGSSTSGKKTSEKKTSEKKTSGKKTSGKKTSGGSVSLTAAEKNLLELYRAADAKTKKAALDILKEKDSSGDLLGSLLGNAVNLFSGKK